MASRRARTSAHGVRLRRGAPKCVVGLQSAPRAGGTNAHGRSFRDASRGRATRAYAPDPRQAPERDYGSRCPLYRRTIRALIGPLPEIKGLYVLTGDNEAGITHGPGYGRATAELITCKRPFIDLEAFRVDRFEGGFSSAREVAVAIAGSDDIFFQ